MKYRVKLYILVLICACSLCGRQLAFGALSVSIECTTKDQPCTASPDHFELNEKGEVVLPRGFTPVNLVDAAARAHAAKVDAPAQADDTANAASDKTTLAGPSSDSARWDCQLVIPSGPKPCQKVDPVSFTSANLLFQFKNDRRIQVSVPIIINPDIKPLKETTSSRVKLFAPLLLFVLPLAALLWLPRQIKTCLETEASSLNGSVLLLEPIVAGIGQLNIPVGGFPIENIREVQAAEHRQDATIFEFLRAVDAWCSTAGRVPNEIEKNRQYLRGAFALDDRTRQAMYDIAVVATEDSDKEDCKQENNRPLRLALIKMIDTAGLQYIDPTTNDYFDPARHVPTGPNMPPPDWSNSGKIARTNIRGLEEIKGGRVLSPARVTLYG